MWVPLGGLSLAVCHVQLGALRGTVALNSPSTLSALGSKTETVRFRSSPTSISNCPISPIAKGFTARRSGLTYDLKRSPKGAFLLFASAHGQATWEVKLMSTLGFR